MIWLLFALAALMLACIGAYALVLLIISDQQLMHADQQGNER
jgi:hypothetical protein